MRCSDEDAVLAHKGKVYFAICFVAASSGSASIPGTPCKLCALPVYFLCKLATLPSELYSPPSTEIDFPFSAWQTQFGKQNPRHNNNRNRIRHQQATVQGACGEFAIPAEGLGTDIKRCQVLSNSIAGETSPSSSSPASLLSFALCNSN